VRLSWLLRDSVGAGARKPRDAGGKLRRRHAHFALHEIKSDDHRAHFRSMLAILLHETVDDKIARVGFVYFHRFSQPKLHLELLEEM
jgi:hypothetical protein